ncbi:kinase domain protein, putative (macronuclear) [Tetrahymena thermophila SB210]|uniref:Kinase domain protein, putative n=1 Tax=Tetrahymena thermophila (strain SB210) TaxID=312017 RepID=W7WY07_TETTS|nr:kinase domain protein, putative [Tetrahymena thermophila SB210]EWS71745.1 kinase domain protein, putative [Tetrahymena thermophila SB210]|eukprot:XP_012655731.1 kinase domain protein, putative [Tetrahymena thermophila SB210]
MSIYFHGIPATSTYKNIFQIKVIASDGYTSTYDIFYIDTSGISFQFIINLLLKILPPIFTILGLYKYRSFFINKIFKQQVFFSTEQTKIGEILIKKIPLLGNNMIICRLIFKGFLKKIEKQSKKQEKGQNSQLLQPNQNQIKIKENNLTENSVKNQQIKLHKFTYKFVTSSNNKKIKQALDNTIKIIHQDNINTKSNILQIKYLMKNGNVDFDQVLKDIFKFNITFKHNNIKYEANQFNSEFKNKNSIIYRGLKALISRYLLKLDFRSYSVYNIDDLDQQAICPFPECQLNLNQLKLILMDLQIIKQMNQSYESIIDQQFNPHLIREVLISDALGLVDYKPSVFHPCVGESIHLFSYQIHSIEAYQQLKSVGCFTQIQKFLNIDYVQFGIHKNMSLPKWIKVQNNNNVVILKANPKSQDFGKILIKIFDLDQYIVKQYFLEVINGNQEESNYQKQQITNQYKLIKL